MPFAKSFTNRWFALLLLLSALPVAEVRGQAAVSSKALSDSIEVSLANHSVPGAAILTFSASAITEEIFLGTADLETGEPVGPGTVFCVGSIAKSFLAAAILRAQQDGDLDIYRPLAQTTPVLPYRNRWENTSPVTLAHLMEHSSGFDDAHFDLEARASDRTPLSEVVALSKSSLESQWEPGTANVYNNLGAIAAAYLLEEATGTGLESYVDEHIFRPLGITTATYRPAPSSIAQGYQASGEPVSFPAVAQWPVGALSMTGPDLARFVRMLLGEGTLGNSRVLRSQDVVAMETPETYIGSDYGLEYGYGKGLMQKLEKGHVFIGHTGQYGGFSSEFGYSKALNFGYLVLLNQRDGSKAIEEIKERLLPDFPAAAPPASYSVSTGYLDSLTGGYQLVGSPIGLLYPFLRLADIQRLQRDGDALYQQSMLGGRREVQFVARHVTREAYQPTGTGLLLPDRGLLRSDGSDYRRISTVSAYLQFWTAAACVVVLLFGLVLLPIQLLILRRRKSPASRPLLWAYVPLLVLVAMFGLSLVLYDTTVLYSAGAVLYFVLSLLLGIAIIASVIAAVRTVKRTSLSRLVQIELVLLNLVTTTVFGYLLYWGLIGLRLWDY